jgi:LysR family transcriptional regulator, benzoate and cis,cis-muconate-responsive activator of ben and cat genes
MDLRDMRYFLAVAEERNFGRAALRLHISQPPLTRQIQGLEARLGTQLFRRTPKGVELTDAGQILVDEVPNLLILAERAQQRVKLAGKGLLGQLDVGIFGSGILDVIPRILSRFHTERPGVKIVLHNMTKQEQLLALRERRIAVGFNRLVPQEPDLVIQYVMREPMVVALNASHPLALKAQISLIDLDNQPLILYPNIPMRGLAQVVMDAFDRHGLRVRVEQDVEDVLTAVALVASGFGIAITTQSATNLRLPGVVFRPLPKGQLPDVELSCLYRKTDNSSVLLAFLEVVHAFTSDPKVSLTAA